MISAFKFQSYKIDSIEFKIQQNLGLLQLSPSIDPSLWSLNLQVRVPQFFEDNRVYVGGLDLTLMLFLPGLSEEQKTSDAALIRLKAGIAGCFSCDGRFDKKIEENLVRVQIPAILLPYLRGTVTTLLANAGFGSVVLPLINIQEFAEKYLQGQQIQVTSASSPQKV